MSSTSTTGVGDYIHYKAFNYRLCSIAPRSEKSLARKDGNTSPSAQVSRIDYLPDAQTNYKETKNALRKLYANNINQKKAKDFENKMNAFKKEMKQIQDAISRGETEAEGERQKGIQESLKTFEDYIEREIPGATVDILSLTAAALEGDVKQDLKDTTTKYSGVKRAKDKNKNFIKNEKGDYLLEPRYKKMYMATVERQINGLAAAWNVLFNRLLIAQQKGASEKTINNLSKYLERINKMSADLVKIMNSTQSRSIDTSQKINGKTLPEIFTEYNKLVRYLTVPSTEELKLVGEAGIGIFAYLAATEGSAVGAELLKDMLIGTTPVETKLYFGDNITGKLISGSENKTYLNKLEQLININKKKVYNKNTWKLSDGGDALVNSSYGTADIGFSLSSNSSISKELGLDNLLISAKNYASHGGVFAKGIGIADTSLLEILMMTLPGFANHYLNLLSTHGNRGSLSSTLINEYSETVKYALAVRGFSGARNLNSGSKANNITFFILNDTTKNKITVISVSSLLTAFEDVDKMNSFLTFSNVPTDLRSYNNWVGQASYSQDNAVARIVKLLARIHRIKISATISPNFYANLENIKLE